MADPPTPTTESTKLSLFTTVQLKSEYFVHFSFAFRAATLLQSFKALHQWFPPFAGPLPTGATKTRKLLGCIPVIFKFLGNLISRAQTELIQHQMLSHVLWCNVVHVNCPSDTFTFAFTSSCRVLLSILFHCRRLIRGSGGEMLVPVTDSGGLSHFELFGLSRGLGTLDNRFRLQRISHKAHASCLQSNANSVYA